MKIEQLAKTAIDIFGYDAQKAIYELYNTYMVLGLKYYLIEGYAQKQEINDFLTSYGFKTRNNEVFTCIEESWGTIVVVEYDSIGNYKCHQYSLGTILYHPGDVPGEGKMSVLDTVEKLENLGHTPKGLEGGDWKVNLLSMSEPKDLFIKDFSKWRKSFIEEVTVLVHTRCVASQSLNTLVKAHMTSSRSEDKFILIAFTKGDITDDTEILSCVKEVFSDLTVSKDIEFKINKNKYVYIKGNQDIVSKEIYEVEYSKIVPEFPEVSTPIDKRIDDQHTRTEAAKAQNIRDTWSPPLTPPAWLTNLFKRKKS